VIVEINRISFFQNCGAKIVGKRVLINRGVDSFELKIAHGK
jgi:hypothetical protein